MISSETVTNRYKVTNNNSENKIELVFNSISGRGSELLKAVSNKISLNIPYNTVVVLVFWIRQRLTDTTDVLSKNRLHKHHKIKEKLQLGFILLSAGATLREVLK